MKKRNIITHAIAACLLATTFTSCEDWLDVKMSDKVMENTLYSTNNGFVIALNGVYTSLPGVYNTTLGPGVIDVMAQYYNVTENIDHSYKVYAGYKFEDPTFENMSGAMWTRMYEMIANLNTILDHCDEANSALRPNYYPLIKGEALALRAMLHFDLLRIYGPIYSEATENQESIPYQDEAKREITPILPAKEVLSRVIRDLEEAAKILKDGDPILEKGIQNNVPSDDGLDSFDFAYRQLRLNYYAVQTLLARAYMWKGDKEKAYQIAKNEIIDKITTEELEVFPWAEEASITDDKKPDRLFSSEVMFSTYSEGRSNMFNSNFSGSLQLSSRLTFIGSGISNADSKTTIFYDDDNDWRRNYLWGTVSETIREEEDDKDDEDDKDEPKVQISLYLQKYEEMASDAELDGSETYRYMIPLIRLSEVYMIAAECTQSDEEALEYINTVRDHRGCKSITMAAGTRQELITKEFAREVLGEGQLFYYYKRLAMEEIVSGTVAGATQKMNLGNYVWPLPDVETDKRGTINE